MIFISVFGHLVLLVDWPILDEKIMDIDFICGFGHLVLSMDWPILDE
jgi:hypothetical protein